MTVVSVPSELRKALGDAASNSLVDFINKVQEGEKDNTIDILEIKFEKKLTVEITRIEKK